MRGRPFLVLLVGLLGLLAVGKESLSGQVGLQEVTSLRFQGNTQFSDQALAGAIITRETECRTFIFIPFCLAGADFSLDPYFLNERELRRDYVRVQLFYYLNGFREAVVDTMVTRVSENEVRLLFQIQEGEPIRVVGVEFVGVEELPDSSVLEDLPIRTGEPLSLSALDATRDTLETRLKNRGFAHAEVLKDYFIDDRIENPHEARVVIQVYPGPLTRFGAFTVNVIGAPGKEPTMDEAVVRRMLPFQENDIYGEDLQFAGQRSLYNLEIFRDVRIEPDSNPAADSILPLTITLQEGNLHRVRTGGGINTAECLNFEAGWGSRNFRGGARRLQLTGRLSNVLVSSLSPRWCSSDLEGDYGELAWSLSAEFTQPWFFSPRNSISATLFAEHRSVAPIFVREAKGIGLGLNRTLGSSTVLGITFRPQKSSLTAADVFFCSAYLICTPEEIRVFGGENTLSPVGVSLIRDRRNQILSPTRGYSAVVDFEQAGDWTGSDFRYTRIISEATWHTQGRTQWVLGARLRGGWVSPEGFRGSLQNQASGDILHPEKRLFAGGSNSVRGFAQNRLGPRVLYVDEVQNLLGKTGEKETLGPCTPEEINNLSCDAGLLLEKPYKDGENAFFPSPTGGTRLLEGSLELRFPLVGPLWEGATFVDFGQVWDEDETPRLEDLEFTPGLGIRFFSPIGPIRVDLGYRFGEGEELRVVTKDLEPYDPTIHKEYERLKAPYSDYATSGDLIFLDKMVLWEDQIPRWDLRRVQLHFSIGQAF